MQLLNFLDTCERRAVVQAGERFYRLLSRLVKGNPTAIRQALQEYCRTVEEKTAHKPND